MTHTRLQELHSSILYAKISAEVALDSIKLLVAGDHRLHFNAEALDKVIASLQSSLHEVDQALRPAAPVAEDEPALAQAEVKYVETSSPKKWVMATGMLEGETAQSAAIRWADWCTQNGQVMLSRFLCAAAPKLRKLVVSEVYMVCDAYESGVGHGLKNDGKYDDYYGNNAVCNEGYKVGYNFGLEKKKILDHSPAEAIDDRAIANTVDQLTDVAMVYNNAQQLRQRISQVVAPVIQAGRKDSARMQFLHTNGPNNPDKDGFEWGVYRVKWGFDGNALQVLQTLSDSSDLDNVMSTGVCPDLHPKPSGSAS